MLEAVKLPAAVEQIQVTGAQGRAGETSAKKGPTNSRRRVGLVKKEEPKGTHAFPIWTPA